jgi:hypothetical protein
MEKFHDKVLKSVNSPSCAHNPSNPIIFPNPWETYKKKFGL